MSRDENGTSYTKLYHSLQALIILIFSFCACKYLQEYFLKRFHPSPALNLASKKRKKKKPKTKLPKLETERPLLSNSEPLVTEPTHKKISIAVLNPKHTLQETLPTFRVGQRVFAQYNDKLDYFPAIITETRKGDRYHLHYEDDEIEFNVPAHRISVTKPTENHVTSPCHIQETSDDEGWHIIRPKPCDNVPNQATTKKQRQNRRKKEKKKEIKELIREEAQEKGLHARWGGSKLTGKFI